MLQHLHLPNIQNHAGAPSGAMSILKEFLVGINPATNVEQEVFITIIKTDWFEIDFYFWELNPNKDAAILDCVLTVTRCYMRMCFFVFSLYTRKTWNFFLFFLFQPVLQSQTVAPVVLTMSVGSVTEEIILTGQEMHVKVSTRMLTQLLNFTFFICSKQTIYHDLLYLNAVLVLNHHLLVSNYLLNQKWYQVLSLEKNKFFHENYLNITNICKWLYATAVSVIVVDCLVELFNVFYA